MRKSGRITTLSLLGALLAGWLSVACAHCWAAQAAGPDANDHCQQGPPADSGEPCCDHGDGVCPGAEVGAAPLVELNLFPAPPGPDTPAAVAAAPQSWPDLRAPPLRLAAVSPLPVCSALYLRHCSFLE